MKNKYWIIRVWGGTDPMVHGPYKSERIRIRAAKRLNGIEHSIMRVDAPKRPVVNPFFNFEIGS